MEARLQLRVQRYGWDIAAAHYDGYWFAQLRPAQDCGWAEIFPIVESRVQSEVCPMFFQQGAGDNLRIDFEAVGFTAVPTDRLSTMLHYDSADDALGAAFVGGPMAMAYSRFDERMKADAHAEYLEAIARFKQGDGYAIPGEFVVAHGAR